MKFSVFALSAALCPQLAFGFAPASVKGLTSTQLGSAVAPERVAPDAGYIPDWEDRPGLSPEEFMASDMSKPDLSGMWECPLTKWDSDE